MGGQGGMGGRLATAARGRLAMPSSMGRPGSGMGPLQDSQARPMTAVRAAGFTSAGNRGFIFVNFYVLLDILCRLDTGPKAFFVQIVWKLTF